MFQSWACARAEGGRQGRFVMMEDAGEDVLRQKPNVVVTFFRRLGQVLVYWELPIV